MVRQTANASTLDNLPGLPQEIGFAAKTTGRVLPSNLVDLCNIAKDGSISFHEQSKLTIEEPRSIEVESSGPIRIPITGLIIAHV